MSTPSQADRRRRGTTLIEVMVAAVILAALAIAGGAILHRVRALLYHERNLRVATDIASSRLERLRAAPYHEIMPDQEDYDPDYLKKVGAGWTNEGTTHPGESEPFNGHSFPITTTVRFGDLTNGPPFSFDFVVATVDVAYGPDPGNRVRLETYLAP